MNRLRNLFVCLCPALLLAASHGHAGTAVWSDDFENNAANRWESSSSGVWKIGSPGAGPPVSPAGYRTHSGANCAYTQNYRANTDSRFICINYNGSYSLVIPSADQQPRLRFWHWFNFVSALGFVEISTNLGSTWNQISPTYENINGGGIWSRPSIDLTAYAGQSVQFAFRFYGSGTGNGLGWYVDDVEVDTGTPVLDFPESFEFDPKMSDWSVDFGTWEIGEPASGPGKAHTGTNCAATVLAGNYANYANSRLISPPFTVPTTSATLRYWQWYSFSSALGFVEINNDTVTTITTTNTTITTNVMVAGFDTNIYQLVDAAIPADTNAFYWNSTIGEWTNNANKALGLATNFGTIYFEAGTIPLSSDVVNYDYRYNVPVPTTQLNLTNFLENVYWVSPVNGNDIPFGNFYTNYLTTYTTNTGVNTTATTWNQISATYQNGSGGAWIQETLDLTPYAGETVQLAFHFGSGAGSAAGWYVDDLSLAASPLLTVPANQIVYAGQTLVVTNYATNSLLPNATYTFKLLSPPPNVFMTNGVITWQTAPNQPPSTNTITVMVTDNNVPPDTATNSFTVTVVNSFILTVPPTQTNYGGMTLTVTNTATNVAFSGAVFTFRLPSPSTNVYLTTNGVLTWTNTGVKNGILYWTNNSISPGTQVITVAADTFDSVPLSVTNRFDMVFLPPHPPSIIIPTNLAVYVGQTLTVTNVATNNYVLLTNVSYTFKAVSSNVLVTSQGVMTWTNTAARPGIYGISIKVTDNSVPPLSATNNSSAVAVLPLPSQLILTNEAIAAHGGPAFAFKISTPWTNTPWRIEAATNLDANATNWLPVFTNQNGPAGAIMFTDRLATNFLQRYYRAIFP